MSPAFVFVVPAVVTAVLAVVTGLAYARTRTAYLLWWAVVWGLAVVYYLTFISSSMAGSQQADIFANIGVVTAALGWARVVGLWSGARLLVNRPVSRRTWGVLLPVSFVWLVLLTGLLADQPFTPALTRLSFAFWYLLGAAELLLRPPRTMVGIFCGSALLLLGIFGLVASQLVVDLTGSMLTNWGLTALFLALGLGVLGRLLEEERERAAAHSRELAAANARLAELDQLKDDFVSMISHELRTPLGLIKGYAGTLLQPELVHDESTRKEFLTVIDEETDRLTELVSNLLDMSRIEAGTLRMDLQPTDLQHLLVDCSARLRAREPGRALDLQVEVEPDEALPAVLADARRITQVVDNLLTNAARYSPTESPIVLRAHARNGYVQVEVVDHGRGIPPDKREHVFNRFVRLDEQPGGSGLGLAICRGIIEAHAGRIWVDSQVGRGSTFAFSLPRARAPTA